MHRRSAPAPENRPGPRPLPKPPLPHFTGWLRACGISVALVAALSLLGGGTAVAAERNAELKNLRRMFADPPREYSSAPLWVWNDLITEEQVRSGLRDFAGQSVKQVFVHPRPGLMTPYLGDDWFRLWKVALDEAERLDMNVWIYDENSYPSGFAGGWVPEGMPESRGQGLEVVEVKEPGSADPDRLGLYAEGPDGVVDLTSRADAAPALPRGSRLWEARRVWAKPSSWTAGRPYVNLLTPGVTEKFIEVTLGAYDRHVSGSYGVRIPGVFTDEPNIRPVGRFPWADDLSAEVNRQWGMNLREHLPSLVAEVGDWKRVRHHYHATLSRLFLDRWAKPYYQACDARGLEFTGHYWDHEWPHTAGVPDNMAMAAWQHRPGIDVLMNQFAENTHAQFGNLRICREVSSIAHQLGRERTLVELYGAAGWDLRLVDMKRIADWLLALGINTMDEHLSYMTLRGARKRDHPQSFSRHEPWWPAYHVHARYMARLCAALSQGRTAHRVLVLEPTTTAWMYQGNDSRLGPLGDGFFQLLARLESAQVEYDLGCEDVLATRGSVGGAPRMRSAWASAASLRVGQAAYEVVILPPGTENLETRTWELLNDFALAGGRIVVCGELPDRISGQPRTPGTPPSALERFWKRAAPEVIVAALRTNAVSEGVVIQRAPEDPGKLFHHRRVLAEGELLFLANTSADQPSRGEVMSVYESVERWDPATGAIEGYPSRGMTRGRVVSFDLPPAGSLLLFFGTKPTKLTPADPLESQEVPSNTDCEPRRIGPNVLTLDHVDLAVAGEERRGVYFYEANRAVWQKHGLPANPWDNAVQFRDETLKRVFPDDTGFSLTYRFTVEGTVPADLEVVIERADLYGITCNGRVVVAKPGASWLDSAFHRVPLGQAARTGENEIVLTARPMTIWHEVEPAYLLGSFQLRSADRGWVVVGDAPLKLERGLGWDRQGHPFYGDGVAYRQEFTVRRREGRYVVRLGEWLGSVARVDVQGKSAGWITAPPWECDVTDQIRRGDNRVEVIVFGTLRNPLGPHHNGPVAGSAWPGMFQKGPAGGQPAGDRYATLGYGLFEPFTLQQRLPRETPERR